MIKIKQNISLKVYQFINFSLCGNILLSIYYVCVNKPPPALYAVVECGCHISLATSIFLTLGLSVERFQVPPT